MEPFWAWTSGLAIVLTSLLLARWLRARGADWIALGYVISVCLILGYGYLLALGNGLGTPAAWAGLSLSVGGTVALATRRLLPAVPVCPTAETGVTAESKISWGQWVALILLGGTAIGLAVFQCGVILLTAPHNYDSMTCHLSRAIHFWQQGNLDSYPTLYWGQVMHPRHHAILLLYFYMLGGENFTQAVQFFSGAALIGATYGIARRLEVKPVPAALSAMIAALLTNVLMERGTTQNDLIISASVAAGTYFLLTFRATRAHRYLVLAALPLGIFLGIKGSAALALPSLVLVAGYALWPSTAFSRAQAFSAARTLLGAAVVVGVLFVLPSGYLANCRQYGHPLGPIEIRHHHTYEGVPLGTRAVESGKNLLRFLVEFTYLDGMPPRESLWNLHFRVHKPIRRNLERLNLDLERDDVARRVTFKYRAPVSHEDGSSFGILGLALIWPAVLLTLCQPRAHPGFTCLAAATVLFVVVQAWASPYDPWRGRYFTWATALAVPVSVLLLDRGLSHWIGRTFLHTVMALGCFSAFCAVTFHTSPPLWFAPVRLSLGTVKSVFVQDRIERVTRNRPGLTAVVRRFEELVPADATVKMRVLGEAYEYVFLGATARRHILPDLPSISGADKASYLLYTVPVSAENPGYPEHPEDILLGTEPHANFGSLNYYLYSLPEGTGSSPNQLVGQSLSQNR